MSQSLELLLELIMVELAEKLESIKKQKYQGRDIGQNFQILIIETTSYSGQNLFLQSI